MGNGKLIVAIIIVLLLIGGLVGGFLYMQNNSKQAGILQEEMTKLAESDFLNEEIDMNIKSGGDYGKVEEAVKEYLNGVKTTYNDLKTFCNNEDVTKILSPENISADEAELTVVQQKVDEYNQKLTQLTNSVASIASEDEILKTIESKEVRDNYIDVYKNIMLNEAVQAKLTSIQQKAENEQLKAKEKIEGLEKVVEFLQKNSKYWEVNDGKLQFTNVNKLGEYYQLLNGAEQ
ncbi:MAG: hypothetical protein IKF83_04695 [Clostridia bacterium]|nr:hypothetical protein [Clostridia bacterium]